MNSYEQRTLIGRAERTKPKQIKWIMTCVSLNGLSEFNTQYCGECQSGIHEGPTFTPTGRPEVDVARCNSPGNQRNKGIQRRSMCQRLEDRIPDDKFQDNRLYDREHVSLTNHRHYNWRRGWDFYDCANFEVNAQNSPNIAHN